MFGVLIMILLLNFATPYIFQSLMSNIRGWYGYPARGHPPLWREACQAQRQALGARHEEPGQCVLTCRLWELDMKNKFTLY